MADEERDGTDVVRQFLGERQGSAHQTRNALPQGIVETFDVIRCVGFLRHGIVLGWWNQALVDRISICVERSLLLIYRWAPSPELFPHPRTADRQRETRRPGGS